MTDAQMAKAIASAVAAALNGAKVPEKAAKQPVDRKAAYEAKVLRGMRKKLGKDADIRLRENVLTFKGWLAQGRVVKKGEKSVSGCFHISQTEEADEATQAKFAVKN